MRPTRRTSLLSNNSSEQDEKLPHNARFAIFVLRKNVTVKLEKINTFFSGLIFLLEKDPLFALELILSLNGSKCLSHSLNMKDDSLFWKDYITPMLKLLSSDELQLGCRKFLATQAFQNILKVPFFLQRMRKFLCHDTFLDPALVLSIVDRVVSADTTFIQNSYFMSVVHTLKPKLSGVMLQQLLHNFQETPASDTQAPLADTSYNTLLEHKFDRHSNDHENIADIELLPPKGELLCKRDPYLPLASDPIKTADKLFDSTFRLLREDVVAPMRDAISLLSSQKSKPKSPENERLLRMLRNLTFGPAKLQSLEFDQYGGVGFAVSFPHPKPYKGPFPKDTPKKKREKKRRDHYALYWKSNKNVLRKGAVLMFVEKSSAEFIRFGEVLSGNHPKYPVETRVEDGVSQVTVKFDETQFPGALSDMLHQRKEVMMIQVDFSFFAYKPVLKRLQSMGKTDFLSDTLLPRRSSSSEQLAKENSSLLSEYTSLQKAVDRLKAMQRSSSGIGSLLPGCTGARRSFTLDKQQCKAVELAFSCPISLIQGPPGTGKSLCGAVIGALLHRFTKLRVLCLCYTNHALDDFLDDLIGIGIPDSDILRIGSGTSADPNARLANTTLNVARVSSVFDNGQSLGRLITKTAKDLVHLETTAKRLQKLVKNMERKSWISVSSYLDEYESDSMSAFKASDNTDGFKVVESSRNRLWLLWITGRSPPPSCPESVRDHHLWTLSTIERDERLSQWMEDIASRLHKICSEYNKTIAHLQHLRNERTLCIIQSRRIIGCTTTGASIYSHLLDSAGIDVLIMEEAGEILEAHSIAAIGRKVQQMILIGDHLQLRPKIQNHLLSDDSSNGRYGLDISLFERLMKNRMPFVCLEEQHRMSEAIATFVTELTYPSLRCAPSVQSRRKLIGFPHGVIFVDHSEAESSASVLNESGCTTSRTNTHEIDWVVSITEYILWQPEYNNSDIVILALYRDQLLQLRGALTRCLRTHVRLNERDVADLLRTGEKIEQLASSGYPCQREIRISTVDNFQGEEGNIIIASLVRGNDNGDIGFVAQPQRINVLLSRAREGMIFVGNSSTLLDSHRGGKMWKDILDIFNRVGAVDRGITVTCPQHRTNQLIEHPQQFGQRAPNGGCDRACGSRLKCGHLCALKCHRGSCTKSCKECQKEELLKRKEERIAREREQTNAQRRHKIREKEHGIQEIVEQTRQKEDAIEHNLTMERLRLEKELAKKKLEVTEETSTEKLASQKRLLDHRLQSELDNLDGCNAESSKEGGTSCNESNGAPPAARDQWNAIDTFGTGKLESASFKASNASSERETRHFESASDGIEFEQTIEDEWKDLRLKVLSEERKSMDELMSLVGLTSVKKVALEIFRKQLADRRLQVNGMSASIIKPALNFSFVGNPGTGKTTVARLFAGILAESGARVSNRFESASASELLRLGEEKFEARISAMCGVVTGQVPPIGKVLRRNLKVEVQCFDERWYAAMISDVDQVKNQYTVIYSTDGSEEGNVLRNRIRAGDALHREGGVLFIDEAYDLVPIRNSKGAAIVNMLMEAAEEHRENLSIILAGYQKDIEEQLFAFNDGMPSRFRQVVFDDFEVTELERVWTGLCKGNGYVCNSDVAKIAARRVARGRKVRSFGNARTVRTLFERSCSRRLQKEVGGTLELTAEDVLGERPSLKQPLVRKIIRELNDLIGLGQIKITFRSLVELAESNYDREMGGCPPAYVPLNRVFVGNPGTGKTTVARLYGLILKALGFLSNGEVISKVASDLMGDHVGQAQQRTKAIVENARGKVLLIDEAYGLDDELYGKQALDTIVERISGAPGEDIAVVFVGYEQRIRLMIDRQNPGLKRRFNMESCKVIFDDFTDDELRHLIDLECRKAGVAISKEAHVHATKLLVKQRAKPNFGNAGNVVTLVKSAIGRWTCRSGSNQSKALSILDVDPAFQEHADPLAPLNVLEDTPVRKNLLELALQIQQRKKEERSTDGLVGNYVFLGGPGTGKTTIARKLAKVLFDFGVLASDLVVETSSSDLIGSYVGHSRANVESKMKESRGGVCFIDEAYHLGVGPFGSEALTQLLTMLTMPEYMDGKTIVVLAGYKEEVHKMLESNPGLKSRFSSYLNFDDWTPQKCTAFICKLAAKEAPSPFTLDVTGRQVLQDGFVELSKRPGWANARDAIQLYKEIMKERDIRKAKSATSPNHNASALIFSEDISKAICTMLEARPARLASASKNDSSEGDDPVQVQQIQHVSSGQLRKERNSVREGEATSRKESRKEEAGSDRFGDNRNEESAGVEGASLFAGLLQNLEELELDYAGDSSDEHAKEFEREKQRLERGKAEVASVTEVIRNLQKKAKTARKRRRIEQKEKALRGKLEKERKRQAILNALMSIGKCPAGYKWNRIGNGFRCGGGSHYASFEDIAERTGFSIAEVVEVLNEG